MKYMHPRPSSIVAALYTARDLKADVAILHGPSGCSFKHARLLEEDGMRVLTTSLADNEFIFGDVYQSGTDSQGRVAAGGSVDYSNMSVASEIQAKDPRYPEGWQPRDYEGNLEERAGALKIAQDLEPGLLKAPDDFADDPFGNPVGFDDGQCPLHDIVSFLRVGWLPVA